MNDIPDPKTPETPDTHGVVITHDFEAGPLKFRKTTGLRQVVELRDDGTVAITQGARDLVIAEGHEVIDRRTSTQN